MRAAQEGVVFTFYYGMEIMKNTGIKPSIIRAGNTSMFLSPVFRESLSGLTGAIIELYDTDGAHGAAKGAGIGCGFYSSFESAFSNLKRLMVIETDNPRRELYEQSYQNWLRQLKLHLD